MELDGNFAHSDFRRDLLVHETCGHERHDLLLARRERFETGPDVGCRLLAFAARAILRQCKLDGVQHVLVAKRLGEEFDRTRLHRLDGHWNIAVSGYEYDWNVDIGLCQLGLKIEPAHPRQSYVEHEATGGRRWIRVQELR